MKQSLTNKLTQWFKDNIDPSRTSKTEAQRIREAKVRTLCEGHRCNEAHARVIVCRAWEKAGLTPIRQWRWVPQETTISKNEQGSSEISLDDLIREVLRT